MNPTILSKDIEQRGKGSGRLHFIIDNIDVSIINGLRRVITSNIPTLVFRGFPDKDNQINIKKNTTKFNNEYLSHLVDSLICSFFKYATEHSGLQKHPYTSYLLFTFFGIKIGLFVNE